MTFNEARNILAIMFYGTEEGKEINKILNKVDENPWHTGTPTEEGYYLVHLKKYYYEDTCGYMVAKWERNWWRTINVGSYWNLEEEIDAWQKIELFKEDNYG